VRSSDVLEHSDRDDAVEGPARASVVLEPELDEARQPLLGRTLARDLVLLGAERHARDMDAVVAGKEQRHAAEAAADVEHALAGLQIELHGDVALLGFLCLVQRQVVAGIVRARVLQVLIEEAAVEVGSKVVVMVHVAARPARQVDDGRKTGNPLQPPLQLAHGTPGRQALVDHQQVQEIGERPLGNGERAVDIGPPDMEGRMEGQAPVQPPIVKADDHVGPRAGPELVQAPRVIDDAQTTTSHKPPEKQTQREHGLCSVPLHIC
jgi:hypothetical protein